MVLMSSPMVLAADGGEWPAAGGGEAAAGSGAEDRADEDRRNRDTRLSRASGPQEAGPWLRSSYPRSVCLRRDFTPRP
jgi:hypothetical protein